MMSTENRNEDDRNPSETVMLIVTAFGPFGGVPDNPSMALVRELPDFLQPPQEEEEDQQQQEGGGGGGSSSSSWKTEVKERILETRVIETSAEGARNAIQSINENLKQINNNNNNNNRRIQQHNDTVTPPEQQRQHPTQQQQQPIICLHLGVNVSGSGFQIEEYAYNDATFRIPDERQYRPNGERIRSDLPWGTSHQSTYNVEELVEELSNVFPAIETKRSNDPGRFVCNYLYYTSMDQLQGTVVKSSLFLHIPSFDRIPKEIQLEYLAEVMRILCRVELK